MSLYMLLDIFVLEFNISIKKKRQVRDRKPVYLRLLAEHEDVSGVIE